MRVPRRLVGSEWVDAVLYPINDFLEVRSQLYVFLKTRLHTARMRVHLAADYFPTVLLRTEATAPRWEVTAQICRDIAALADRAGIPTLFVLVPTPYQVDPAAFAQFLRGFQIDSAAIDVDQPSRLLRLALEKQHLTVLDALPAFRVAQSAGMTLYGHVDNHLSPAGHGVLERYLEAGVAAKLRDTTPDDR